MNVAVIAAATLGSLAAGWIARSERQRRRDKRVLRTAAARKDAAAPPGPPQAWHMLRRVLEDAEPGDTAIAVSVILADQWGQILAAGMTMYDQAPKRHAAVPVVAGDGSVTPGFVSLDVPADPGRIAGDPG